MSNLIKYNQNLTNRLFDTHPFEPNFLAPFFDIFDRFNLPQQFINQEQWTETNDNYILSLNLAGFKKEEVKVEASKIKITIRAESKTKNIQKSYYKEFSIDENTNFDKIKVEFNNGLLVINIEKPEKEKAKVIDIT